MVLGVLVVGRDNVLADADPATGLTYNISEGEAEITGFTAPVGFDGNLEIPDLLGGSPVTSIGDDAFNFCASLTSISIPDGVTSIGNSSFFHCESLSSITIPDSVTSIGNDTFEACYSLTVIALPNNLQSIGYGAFWKCTSLTGITIPSSVTSVGKDTFFGCTSLSSVTLQSGISIIADREFYGCTSLSSIIIPSSVTSIGDEAFAWSGCFRVTFAGEVTSIGDNAFSGREASVVILFIVPTGTKNYYEGLLAPAVTGLTAVVSETDLPIVFFVDWDDKALKNEVVAPGEAATAPTSPVRDGYTFSGWDVDFGNIITDLTVTAQYTNSSSTITEQYYTITYFISEDQAVIIGFTSLDGFDGNLEIPALLGGAPVTRIGDNAFSGCTSLQRLVIPSGVTSIGDFAFYHCTSLSDPSLPNSVTSIGMNAFEGCTNLLWNPIPSSVTSIGPNAFAWCTGLQNVTIPSGTTFLGNYAFQNCTSLTDIDIKSGVTYIGDSTFYACSSLENIEIPGSVTRMDTHAFADCVSLTRITVPASVTEMSGDAFENDSSVTIIGYEGSYAQQYAADNSIAFQLFSDYTYDLNGSEATITGYYGAGGDIIIPAEINGYTVVGIGGNVFRNCDSVTSVLIPASVTSIVEGAFANNSGTMTSINVNASNTHFASQDGVLYNYDKTTLLGYPAARRVVFTIPDGVTTIASQAFGGGGPDGVVLPDSVTTISDGAFHHCIFLSNVTIPANVHFIDGNPFDACKGLLSIEVDPSNTYFSSQDGVLYNYDKTTIVSYPASKNPDSVFTIPDGVTTVGSGAFNWSGLEGITIPDSVTTIDDGAFSWSIGLNRITIPASVAAIGWGAFECVNNVTIYGYEGSHAWQYAQDNDIPFIDISCDYLYEVNGSEAVITGYRGSGGDITIPSQVDVYTVVGIGDGAFEDCDTITEVTLPADVTSIGDTAFSGCSSLAAAYFYGNAPSMGSDVFADAQAGFTVFYLSEKTGFTNPWNGYPTATFEDVAVTGVSLDTSTATIPIGEFEQLIATVAPENATNKDVIWSVYSESEMGIASVSSTGRVYAYHAGTAVIRATSMTDASKYAECTVTVTEPEYSYNLSDGAITIIGYNGSGGDLIIPSELDGYPVTAIGDWSICGKSNITSVSIPDSITAIGGGAFGWSTGITSISIPDSVVSIGDLAFAGGDFAEILVGEDNPAFSSENGILYDKMKTELLQCPANYVGNFSIPDSVTNIRKGAVAWCKNVTEFTVEAGNTAFACNDGVLFNISMTELIQSPYSASETYIIPEGVTSIGEDAFSNHKNLAAVYIPASVTDIGICAFSDCSNLSAAYFYGNAPSMGNDVFKNAKAGFTVYYLADKTGFTNPWNGYTTATFEDGAVTGVSLNTSSATITVGENVQLTVTVTPDDATEKGVVWSVRSESGTDIATVSSTGLVSANHAGTAVIRATSVADDTKYAECTVTVPAYDFTYTILEGKATITAFTALTGFDGTVEIPDTLGGVSVTSIGNNAFQGCTSLTSVAIPYGVASIGEWTFHGCSSLTGILIPDSMKSLGKYTFYGCTSLTSITIPDSVTSIQTSTFFGCTSLTSITIPNSVISIEDFAFRGCTSLTSITIPDSVKKFGINAFQSCTSLTSITIPDSVTSIGATAFFGCAILTSITIPSSVKSIESNTFGGCTNLKNIMIPDSVTKIGVGAFSGCTSLTGIAIPDSVTSIQYNAFQNCTSLTSITIPNGVTNIETATFFGCTNLTGITIPDSVTSIGEWAFYECTSLMSITLPSSVKGIGDYAFRSCTSLTEITIPDSVTSIKQNTFFDCASLREVTLQGSITSFGTNAFSIGSGRTITFFVPYGLKTYFEGKLTASVMGATTAIVEESAIPTGLTYSITDGVATITGFIAPTGFDGILVIPDTLDGASVTSIGEDAFFDSTILTSITIPDSVTSIGDGAFAGCNNLTDITMSSSLTSIGDGAFAECTSMTGITIPDSVTSIGDWAFDNCTSLTSITIPIGVTSIGVCAFSVCTNLTDITIPSSVTSIGNMAFFNCTSLTGITIPDSVTSIAYGAFSGCTSLTEITIPDSVTSIGNWVFDRCSSLASITLPDSVTSIGVGLFYECESLDDITIPSSVTSIGEYAFSGCTSLTDITIPSSVTSIGNDAFEYCSSLTDITIPDSVTSIGDYMFYDCSSLTDITIPSSVTSIGEGAFAYCYSLTSMSIPSSVTSIGDGAFYECSSLSVIVLQGSVTSIGIEAFSIGSEGTIAFVVPYGQKVYYEGLLSADVLNGTTSYIFETYTDSLGLEYLIIDGEATITDFTAPTGFDGILTIPDTICGARVTSIGDWAFDHCTSLTSISIPNGVTCIGDFAFSVCTSLTSIAIPNSVTTIGEMVFYDCTSLTGITIPSGVTSIKYGAFAGCANLTGITIPNGVTSIGDWAFADCSSLTGITIPDRVTSIGDGAFYECTSLMSITIPSSVTTIGESAFEYCDSLWKPIFEGEKPMIDVSAFDHCAADISIYYHISCAASWDGYTDYPVQPYCYVSFELQDGSIAKELFTEVQNAPITAPAVPVRTDYAFGGWYKESTCTNAWDFANDCVTNDITLYAKWTRIRVNISAIANSSAYGTVTGGGTYNTGTSVSITATPYPGYRFVGWNNGTSQVSTSAVYSFVANFNSVYTAEFEWISTPYLSAASAGYNGIRLTWTPVNGAAWYEIWSCPSAGGAYAFIATTAESTYIDYGRTTNVSYSYQVRVCCTASTATTLSSFSNVASAKPIPAAPTVWVSEASYNKINVSWSPVPGASTYQLYRATSEFGKYTLIKTTSLTSYVNSSLKTGTTYFYIVRAYGTFGGVRVYGDYSASAPLTPRLASVSIATAAAYYPTSIKVSWNAVAGRSYYEVWRSTSPDSGFVLVKKTSSTYYKNTGLIPNTTYYYIVRAYRVVSGIKIYSNFSPMASATTVMGTLTGAKAVRTNATTNKISWAAVTGRTKYEVWYSSVADGEYVYLKETTSTYLSHSGLLTGTPYYYKIRAYRLVGGIKYYGDFSGVVSATP
jgi:uncharacterized repeat protein (TIGR02543 family)